MVAQGSLDDIYHKLSLLQVIHVQVLNLTDAMVEQIGNLHGVADVQVQSDRLSLRMHPDQTQPEDLLQGILALKARVRMFQPEALDMETVFMKLTEGRTT